MSDFPDLDEIDDFAYRVWKAIETKHGDAAREKIKARDAAQRQAGREEMSSAEYVLRLISEPDPWYRDMSPEKQVYSIRDRARKALHELDKGRETHAAD